MNRRKKLAGWIIDLACRNPMETVYACLIAVWALVFTLRKYGT